MVEMKMHQESNSCNTLIDVSSFMLYESTGDSEFDSNFCSTSHDPMDSFTLDPPYQRFLEDDDAQSCSYDQCDVHLEDEDMDLDFHIENEDNYDDDEVRSLSYSCSDNYKCVCWKSDMEDEVDEEEEEDEGDVVEQGWNFRVNIYKKTKTKVRVDSVTEEFKCQKDKDRLFWETCLAS